MGPSFDIIHGSNTTNMSSISNLPYQDFIPQLRNLYQYSGQVYFRINPFTGSPEAVTPWIQVDPSNLYLTGIMDENYGSYTFPHHIAHYNEDNITLSYPGFVSACTSLNDYFTNNTAITNDTAKRLAFHTSEAARFAAVFEASRCMMEEGSLPGVTGSWSNWSPMLHAWGAMSDELPFASSATAPGLPVDTTYCTMFLDHFGPGGSQFTDELATIMARNDMDITNEEPSA